MAEDVVCVPLKLEAFVLNEELCSTTRKAKIAPLNLPDYTSLGYGSSLRPDVLRHVDISTASPAEVNTRITDVSGTGRPREERLGVYLHWILPKGFRSGLAATSSALADHAQKRIDRGLPGSPKGGTDPEASQTLEFRPVPDRWLLVRFLEMPESIETPGIQQKTELDPITVFLVESNRLQKLEDFPQEADIETEAAPFLDEYLPAHRQGSVFIGAKTKLDLSDESSGQALDAKQSADESRPHTYHSPLTVVNSSNPLFTDFQPHNANVFSLHDDLTYIDSEGQAVLLESAKLSYFLFGYYQNEREDPFFLDPAASGSSGVDSSAPTHRSILKSCFMKVNETTQNRTWLGNKENNRLACHGALYNVNWRRNKSPLSIPAESLAKKLQATHPLSIGVDAMDALESYIEVPTSDGQDGDHSGRAPSDSTRAPSSSLVHDIALLLKKQHEDIHAQREAEKDLIKRRYDHSAGGVRWHFGKDTDDILQDTEDIESSGAANKPQVPANSKNESQAAAAVGMLPLDATKSTRPDMLETMLVHELNVLQSHLDASVRRHDQLQYLLFCEWWKLRGEAVDAEDVDDKEARSARLTSVRASVIDIAAELKRIQLILAATSTDSEKINLRKRLTRLAAHPKLANKLKQGIQSAFYMRKDPTLVFIGIESPWPKEFTSENLQVRRAVELPLRVKEASHPPGNTIPKSWGQNFGSFSQPLTLKSILQETADGVAVDDQQPSVRRWLSCWKALQRCIPTVDSKLQGPLEDLLREWIFLAFDTTDSIESSVPRNPPATQEPSKGTKVTSSITDDGKGSSPAQTQSKFQGDQRLNWNDTQPWFPLFVEWEVEYFHVPYDKWVVEHESSGSIRYKIAEGEQLSTSRATRGDMRTISGRSLILPQILQILKAHVQQLFKRLKQTHGPGQDHSENETLAKAILEGIDALPFLSSKMDGFTDHLRTLAHGTHVMPHVKDVKEKDSAFEPWDEIARDIFTTDVVALMDGTNTDITPYARYLDFQHHPREGRDRSFAPFKPVTHGQARFTKLNIVDKFGQVVPVPIPLQDGDRGYLLPYTSNSLSCQPVSAEREFFANTVIEEPEGQCEFFQLPPSINQDVRLNASFVVKDELSDAIGFAKHAGKLRKTDVQDTGKNPEATAWRMADEWENPVWGWLCINYRDGGLQLFDADGKFLVEALLRSGRVYWRPERVAGKLLGDEDDDDSDNGDDQEESDPQDVNNRQANKSQLDFFIQHLKEQRYIQTLWDVISGALDTLHHAPNSFAEQLPAIVGRPLALVNMGWSLELASAPLEDQSTHLDSTVLEKSAPKAKSVLEYEFELKIGDEKSFRDGMIGYFLPTNLPDQKENRPASVLEDFGQLCTDFAPSADVATNASRSTTLNGLHCISEKVNLRPFYNNPNEYDAFEYDNVQNQALQVFAAIVDPFSIVTGYTGILPPKQIQIQPWVIENALKNMTPFLSIGPVLIPGDIPDHSSLKSASFGAGPSIPANVTHEESSPPTIPAHVPSQDGWIWLQPRAADPDGHDIEYAEINLEPRGSKFEPLEGPHTALEGFLMLKSQAPSVFDIGDGRIPTENFGLFFGDESLQLDISGTGSCGGTPGENVEVAITLLIDTLKLDSSAASWDAPYKTPVDFYLEAEVVLTGKSPKQLQKPVKLWFGESRRISYTRPSTDYILVLIVRNNETGLTLPLQRHIPVDRNRLTGLKPEASALTIPDELEADQPFDGEIVLQDRLGNICSGYDDRSLLTFGGKASVTKIEQNSKGTYMLRFRPLTYGKREISASLNGNLIGESVLREIKPAVDMAKSIFRGRGLCNGQQGEDVEVEVLIKDQKDDPVDNPDVKVEVTQGNTRIDVGIVQTGSPTDASWYRAVFNRPPAGRYEVSVRVGTRHAPGSPFALQSVAQPVKWDITKLRFEVGKTAAQAFAMSGFDSLGARLRIDLPLLATAFVSCTRYLPSQARDADDEAIDFEVGPRGDGSYTGNMSLSGSSAWRCAVQLVLMNGSIVRYELPGWLETGKSGVINIRWIDHTDGRATIQESGRSTDMLLVWKQWNNEGI